jgi:hydroxymethylbilane synthase
MLSSLTIATRQSPLALWQAEHVKHLLETRYPDCSIQLLPITTEGDRRLDVALANIGGKGLFIKELEQAMLEQRADLAVHSLKDMPMTLHDAFTLGAVLEREDPRDVFISHHYRHPRELPQGAKVGTSSPRRATQLQRHYPGLCIEVLRGNLGTRLKKLDDGQYEAILLAAAGLDRLGLFDAKTCTRLEIEEMLPAVGQAVLSIECLTSSSAVLDMIAPLNHEPTALCIQAERAFSQGLAGNCHMPIAAYAQFDTQLHLKGYVGHPTQPLFWENELSAPMNTVEFTTDASELGWLLAKKCQLETSWLEELFS